MSFLLEGNILVVVLPGRSLVELVLSSSYTTRSSVFKNNFGLKIGLNLLVFREKVNLLLRLIFPFC
jgi:hypothetical protein